MSKLFDAKLLVFVCTIVLSSLFFQTDAQQQFLTDYETKYVFSLKEPTIVEQNVTLTNLQNEVFAGEYSFYTKLVIFDVKAFQGKSELGVETAKDSTGGTNVNVKISDYAVGEGKQTKITITYKTNDLVTKRGEVWSINIERSSVVNETSTHNVALYVPKTYGPKIYVSPVPANIEQNSDLTSYFFTKDQLKAQNITAEFGSYQLINFKLNYQLENPNFFKSTFDIALPPDIKNFQQIIFGKLDPQPQKFYIDTDGNSIASYSLRSKQKIEVQFIGTAKIEGSQIDITKSGHLGDIPHNLITRYTKADTYWETKSDVVKSITKTLVDKNATVSQMAFKIYDYLISNYDYDFDNAKENFVDRRGAKNSLNNTKGWACMSFTDSFIALARSVGIPAREINGFAKSDTQVEKPLSIELRSGDVLHAWPEFYDPEFGWVMVDPTWGDTSNSDYFTKIDTGHFAFVIKGIDSSYPLPAGLYTNSNKEHLIQVDYSEQNTPPDFSLKASVENVSNYNPIHILLRNNKYLVTNTSNTILFQPNGKALFPGKSYYVYNPRQNNFIELQNIDGEILRIETKG